MSVVMRLTRGGRKKAPFYHIVVADSRRARDSRFIEKLGYYNPTAKKGENGFYLNEERVNYWHSVGAQTSDAVSKLFLDNKVGPQKVRDAFVKARDARTAVFKKKQAAQEAAKAKEAAKEAAEAKETEAPAEETAPAENVEAAPAEDAKKEDAADQAPAEEVKADDAEKTA